MIEYNGDLYVYVCANRRRVVVRVIKQTFDFGFVEPRKCLAR